MNHSQALRLTPSNSPFFRNSTPKSPTKSTRNEEAGLRLKKVIGTTTATANGFDCLPSARQFAYTAGAAAVVSTVGDDLSVSQRFFRARPTLSGPRDGLVSPTPNDLRSKLVGNLREQNNSASPLGSTGRDWSNSPTGKSATAKDRVKAATSVALSPNGKWVAVGETGYKPRVLIFSNKGDSNEASVSALAEHTFGVHALAFSQDSRYLASLGTVNDGFLYIWSIDERTGAATLHSSNKCTSTINALTWIGRNVLTVGLRYVKVWKADEDAKVDNRSTENLIAVLTPRSKASDFGNSILSPRLRVLAGKNSLLGDMLDANFVAALPIDNNDKAIICADSGEICLLDHSEKAQTLTVMAIVGFRVTAAMADRCGTLLVTGHNGQSKRFAIDEIQKRSPSAVKRERRSTMSPAKTVSSSAAVTTTAMVKIDDIVVELDSKRGIRMTRSGDSSAGDAQVASLQLPAHCDAVLGVQQISCEHLPSAAFLTFAGSGSVHLWDAEGAIVATFEVPVESSPDMYDLTNELRAVAHLPSSSLLVAGDKYGTLTLLDISTGQITAKVRAHSTEVIHIRTFERLGVQLIATASRDRMVQLFAWHDDKLELLQTMDEHAAAVNSLLTAMGGEILLSCSADRTIVVREAMLRKEDDPISLAFAVVRTIALKSAPTSMCLATDHDEILVSSIDKSIGKYSITSGQAGFSFKCSDSEGGEAAAMSKILFTPSLNGNPTIIGVSSSDKSVRLYSEYGSLVARDWGHTEGITDAALLATKSHDEHSRTLLVTVAADSTIFMWDTSSQASLLVKEQVSEADEVADTPTGSKFTPMAPPLRKVLSYSELSRFKRERSIEESDPVSPQDVVTPLQPPSPRRVKKRPSRTSLAQPPKLEPAFSTGYGRSRRESIRKRSPSPPSPKGAKKIPQRQSSLGMSLRSKSSENVLSSYSNLPNNTSSFGSVTSSTESVCRTLRAYRKKLVNASSDTITPHVLRELEKELKLTARVLGEVSQGKTLDEATMAKLLDQASDRIVDRISDHIKERVVSEVRRSRENSPIVESPAAEQSLEVDAIAGALEKVALDSKNGVQ